MKKPNFEIIGPGAGGFIVKRRFYRQTFTWKEREAGYSVIRGFSRACNMKQYGIEQIESLERAYHGR